MIAYTFYINESRLMPLLYMHGGINSEHVYLLKKVNNKLKQQLIHTLITL